MTLRPNDRRGGSRGFGDFTHNDFDACLDYAVDGRKWPLRGPAQTI